MMFTELEAKRPALKTSGQIAGLYVDKKEILTGTIDSMSREEVEKKLQDLKEQYSIETTFEEVKELENKS
jgi:NAD-dependent DNA ligase